MTHTVYIDLTSLLARAATTGTQLPSVTIKHLTSQSLAFAFMTAGTIAAVTGWVSGKVVLKQTPTADVLLLDTMLAESGADTLKRYTAEWAAADCDSDAMRTLIGASTTPIDIWCEVEWTTASGTESVAFQVKLAPTFNLPEDAAPDPTVDASWTWLKLRAPEANGFTHDDGAQELEVDADPAAAAHIADTDNPHEVNATDVGLGNCDNTSDASKPVSTATQTALDLKAPLASPALTGVPTVPTAATTTNTTQAASTAFVQQELNALLDGAPGALNTLNELAAAVNDDASFAATVTTALGTKAATDRKLDDFGAPDDNTDLDATTGRHGLLPKLGGGATNFLRADGTWAAPAGGGGALVRGTGDIQGHTSGEIPASSPLDLDYTIGSFNYNFTASLTADGAVTNFTGANADPVDGTVWIDTGMMSAPEDIAGALASAINGQGIPSVGATVESGTIVRVTHSGTGAASTLAGSTSLDGSSVVGGGAGVDAQPASGAVVEAQLVALAAGKTTRAVRLGFCGDGVNVNIQLALKTAGGSYSALGTVSAAATIGDVSISASTVSTWMTGVSEAHIVARMVDEEGNNIGAEAVPEGGSLTLWAMAEQV